MKTNEFYLRLTLPNEGAHNIFAAAAGVCAVTVAPDALIDPPKTPPGVITCVTWVSHMCDETSFRNHMCDMMHSYVRHGLVICETRLRQLCDMTHSYVYTTHARI